MRVKVFFWFDVEDYITPESDVALGRLIDIFDRHGVKATFKMVAEKVRGLQRRGHYDIVHKLRSHDVGFHTDYHSRPPSISEYMLEYGWEEGRDEFIRREQAGLDTLRTAFQRTPSCYGQPGGAWAPQVYPALRQWGIPVYLDAGPWVHLEGRPHWYCGVLDMLGLDGLMHIGISRGRNVVRQRQGPLAEMVERLSHTGGEISLYAHECEFVTAAFWDGVNYAGGRDTPPDKWMPAPLISEQESQERYAAMDEFLSFVCSLKNVDVVVASQAPMLYRDRAKGRRFAAEQVAALSAHAAEAVVHQACDGVWLSAAEVYGLTIRLLAEKIRIGAWPETVPYQYVDGPFDVPQTEMGASSLALDDVFGTCLYEDAFLDTYGRMPSQVQIGRNWLAPADFLATIGARLPRWLKGSAEDAPIRASDFAQASCVPDHVDWGWVIFPPGFNADPLLTFAKLQAWTLKPARADDVG